MGLARQLWFQVLAGTLAGIALGLIAPHAGEAMKPLGDGFIKLIKMLIAPVVFCTVVHGVAGMEDMRRAGRVALKAILYFEAITTLALILGLVVVNLWRPGEGMNVDLSGLDAASVAQYADTASHQTFTEFALKLIPETFIGAFTKGEVLPVLLAAIITALALSAMGPAGRPAVKAIGDLAQLFFRIVGLVMVFAPLGAFGAIAVAVGKFGPQTLISLGSLIAEFFAVCALFTVLVLAVIARLAEVSLIRLIAFLRDEVVLVAATTSAETVLPRLMEKLKAMGCEESVVGLVVPTGYSFNLDGTCLYLASVTIFLAQATNTHLDLAAQVGLLLVMLLTSKGAAGVAGAAFVVLAATLSTSGAVPVTAIALVLGVHRLLAEALTFVNLIGNALAAIVVARWEKAVDLDKLAATVGVGALRPA
ncbi:MAG: C4-dicarboxylate transporter DctA [Caulobacteraceae bacterium]